MHTIPILSFITFFPLIGAGLIFLLSGEEGKVSRLARWIALVTTSADFIASLYTWINFRSGTADFQFEERVNWLPGFNISYHMGLDGISIFFVLISTFLLPICILASWEVIKTRVKEYMIAFLVLETMMVGMFCALDLFIFYIFYEGVLIPMLLIIGVWGGPRRIYAAMKFFLYTLTGSVLMLLSVITMHSVAGTSDIPTLLHTDFPTHLQYWIWLGFFASFAVKVPMWPVHTWLPDAHVEAPTAGSVILAGILLKMGGYGFLRFSIPMLPDAAHFFAPMIFTLGSVAIVYTSLTALAQVDMKKLIAYSSIAHMGAEMIGVFAVNRQAVDGAIFQMLSHGIFSAGLFLCVGVVYDRTHTREIARYGGLATIMPKYSFVFMIFMLAAVGLPGTSGFVGELLTIVGVYVTNPWAGLFVASGVVFGVIYMLYLYRRIIFGVINDKMPLKDMVDLTPREIAIFAPMVVIIFWMGIYPSSFLGIIDSSVANLVTNYHQHFLAKS